MVVYKQASGIRFKLNINIYNSIVKRFSEQKEESILYMHVCFLMKNSYTTCNDYECFKLFSHVQYCC